MSDVLHWMWCWNDQQSEVCSARWKYSRAMESGCIFPSPSPTWASMIAYATWMLSFQSWRAMDCARLFWPPLAAAKALVNLCGR